MYIFLQSKSCMSQEKLMISNSKQHLIIPFDISIGIQ
jgi:hypothetical protein